MGSLEVAAEEDLTPGIEPAAAARRPRRLPAWLPLSAVGGALLILAFPPYDQGWLAWIAPIPLFAALLAPRVRPGWAGFVAGFLFFLGHLTWMRPFAFEGWIAGAVICGGFWALAALVAGWAVRRTPRSCSPALLAAAWTVIEWLRCQGPFGFPWGVIASTQHRSLWILQLLDLTGPFGLTFLILFFAASAAAAIRWQPGARLSLTVAVVLVLLASARGGWLLAEHGVRSSAFGVRSSGSGGPDPTPNTERLMPKAQRGLLRVTVLQASVAIKTGRLPVYNLASAEDYELMTRTAVDERAALVVWPETTLPEGTAELLRQRVAVARLLEPGTWIIGGAFARDPTTGQPTNSALDIDSGAHLAGRYDKRQRVPYGEYVPARGLYPWIVRYGVPQEDLAPGTSWDPLPVGTEKVGVCICFESAFPQITRQLTRNGATLLAILTSDAWRDRPSVGLQHAAMAPLRAIETRRSIARAAATGISALIDPYGRTIAEVPIFSRGMIVEDLPVRSDITWYVRLGDWPVWLSLALLGWGALGLGRSAFGVGRSEQGSGATRGRI